jgi:hypothetical protein
MKKIRTETIGRGHELMFECEDFENDEGFDTLVTWKYSGDRCILMWISWQDVDAFIDEFRQFYGKYAI